MSNWNHYICAPCYEAHEPGRNPIRIREDDPEKPCCLCKTPTNSGIYYRHDPAAWCRVPENHDDD